MRPFTIRPIALLLLAATSVAAADHGFGPVEPALLPDLTAHDQAGREVSLRSLVTGRRTAVQFVFTECPTTCPLLGSLFQRVQKALLPTEAEAQLLTISVDPERDTPARLTTWLSTFHAVPRWTALRIKQHALNELLRTFRLDPGPAVAHSLQIFLIDSSGRYIARTTALPTAAQVLIALRAPEPGPPPHPGAQLYLTKSNFRATVDGEPIAPHAARCANCHGPNRTGRTEGEILAPALLPATLLTPQPRRGGPPSAYSEAAFCQLLQTGRDPAGVHLSSVMPRYQLDPRACHLLWQFLTSPR
jgi:protein SCO1/2